MSSNQKKQRWPEGQVMILGLVFLAVISLAVVSLVTYEGTYVQLTRKNYEKEKALEMAEAGLNKAIWSLNQMAGAYNGETFNFGNGVVVVQVTDLDPQNKLLEATGYLPDNLSPRVQKKIILKASAEPSSSVVSFHYGVQVDQGGVAMGSNAKIIGNIYANGSIQGAGKTNSTITGDAWVAGGMAATADQLVDFYNSDFIFGRQTPQIDAAQSFKPSVSLPLTKVSLYLKKVGSPSNLTVYLVSDNNGKPSKTSLARGTLNASLVTANYSWVEVAFASPPDLIAETSYWILIDAYEDDDRYWVWAKNSLDDYSRGTAFYSPHWKAGNPVWSALGADLNFKIWLGGVTTFINGLTVSGEAHANTIADSAVGGDAYFQTISNTTVGGASYPGSPNPAVQSLPISEGNLAEWKQAAVAGGICAEPICNASGDLIVSNGGSINLGPIKIPGKLILDNGARLNLTGTIWVAGNIEMSNNCRVYLTAGYGGSSGVILTDAKVKVDNNCAFYGSGEPGSYVLLLSAKDSVLEEVIEVNNNAIGVIFYAGRGRIKFSNNAAAKEATAYGLTLDNNATITYESGLANASFTNGPGGAWQAVRGTWQEIK